MHSSAHSPLDRIRLQQWLALPLSLALGGLLVGLLFAFLPAGGAAAAPPAEPAVAYPCSQPGLDSALAAGGAATFTCAVPTTVVITPNGPKLVNKNVSLDGGNKLILSGGGITGVFSVAAGIHLTLLDLTIRDAANNGGFGGGIYNGGHLTVTHSLFVGNAADWGSILFNAPSATAVVSASRFYYNSGNDGGLTNGSPVTTSAPAALIVANSVFSRNNAFLGSAILNLNGSVTVTGSTFYQNLSFYGGAIYDLARLTVDQSQFFNNSAAPFVAAAQNQPQASSDFPALPTSTGLRGGGAIGIGDTGNVLVANTAFTSNFGIDAGGAIFFATLPLDSNVLAQTGSLLILNSTFDFNCTAGAGGAVSTALAATIRDSVFTQNTADASPSPCFAGLADQFQPGALAGDRASHVPSIVLDPSFIGVGGAIFNAGSLTVSGATFLSNTATLTATTTAGGGGAIQNGIGASLDLRGSTFTANTAQQDGGAIYDAFGSRVTVIDSSFTHNRAISDTGGALANLGELTVTHSLFFANSSGPASGSLGNGGGAIFSDPVPVIAVGLAGPNGQAGPNGPGGPAPRQAPTGGGPPKGLHVANSTFVANTSDYEGGAIDASYADIVSSSFTSNTAAYGGAIDVLNQNFVVSGSTFIANGVVTTTANLPVEGGAIDSNSYSMTVINSTFYANWAAAGAHGGAINGDDGALWITNSTFVSNTVVTPGEGGAFSANAAFSMTNDLIAYNVGGNCQLPMALDAHNLDYPNTTCGGAALHLNPQALAPANNGGPTLTSALLPNSPAINAGHDSGCPNTDQRGAHRPTGAHCDIGAFEFGGLVPWLWLPLIMN